MKQTVRCLLLILIACAPIVPASVPHALSQGVTKDTNRRPGITDTTLRVATVIPANGALAELGTAMRAALAAYFADVNARGGIFNRKIELRVVEAGSTPAETADRLRALTGNDEPLAIVGGMTAGADAELNEAANWLQVPFIGPATLTPASNSRYVFYVLSGIAEQSKAMVNFAATVPELQRSKILIVSSDATLQRTAAKAAEEQAWSRSFGVAARHVYPQSAFTTTPILERLKVERTEVMLFFGASNDLLKLLKEAANEKLTPTVFLLGVFSGGDLTNSLSEEFKDRVFLAFPTVPNDVTSTATTEYRTLQTAAKLPSGHIAAQFSAIAAGKIFVEAVRRAGKDLTRTKLLSVLESMSNYETGLTPPVTFAPNQHVGAAGAYIIKIDVEKKTFAPASGWISGK